MANQMEEEAKRDLFAIEILESIIEKNLEKSKKLNKDWELETDPIEKLKMISRARGISDVNEELLSWNKTLLKDAKEKSESLKEKVS